MHPCQVCCVDIPVELQSAHSAVLPRSGSCGRRERQQHPHSPASRSKLHVSVDKTVGRIYTERAREGKRGEMEVRSVQLIALLTQETVLVTRDEFFIAQ